MAQDNDWWKQGATAVEPAKPSGDWWTQGATAVAPTRTIGAALNDTVIEVANAAAGGVSSAANFVKPGNAVSGWIDKNIIKAGEDKQSDVVKAEKARLSSDLANAEGIGDEVAAVGRYIVNNPVLAAAQAAGSFVGPGLAVKGAQAGARAASAGAKAVERAGRAGGVAAGAAMAGGDAAGTAHELASKAGATDDQAVAAGRQASVIPALVGGVGGAFGAEKLLAGAKGFAGGTTARALKTGASEALQEGIEEGVTQYEGQRAAVPFDPSIDPAKGVAGAAAMGAALGGITGAGMGAFDAVREGRSQHGRDPISEAARQAAEAAAADAQAKADAAAPPWTTGAGAADPDAPASTAAAADANAPRVAEADFETLPGAAPDYGNTIDFRRDFDTGTLALADEDLAPSQRMGLDARAGSMSAAAVVAVDSGAHAQMQRAADTQAAIEEDAAVANVQQDRAREAAKQAKKQPAGQQDIDQETGEIAGSSISQWTDADLSTAFRAAQSKDVRRQLAQELARRRARREEDDLQAELDAEQAGSVPGAEGADSAFASVTEDDGAHPAPAATTKEGQANGAQADQAEQTAAQPAQAGGPPRGAVAGQGAGRRSAGAPPAPAVQGLTDGATPTANPGAQAGAPAAAQAQAQDAGRAQRAQRIADAGAAWTRMPTAERRAVAARLEGVKPVLRQNLHGAQWDNLNGDIKAKLADAISPENAAPALSHPALDAIESGATAALATAAHQAATSPTNDLPAPTEAQRDAGNYRKGHTRIHGHDISIENPAGSKRRPEWPALQNHYGYIKGTVGKDKDHVDVFLTERAHEADLPVFVVDQNNADGSFDEHKVVMGAADEAEARRTYLANYSKGWTGLGGITQMTQDEFKAWVRDPAKTKKPAARPTQKPAAPARKPRGVLAKKAAAEAAARADYFTPGNIVKGYSGHSRVISYSPPDENGRWSVTVRSVEKQGDAWVDVPGERERTHATQPDARELKAGPVLLAEPASQAPVKQETRASAGDAAAPGGTSQATASGPEGRAAKPRLGESADAVWAAIKEANGGVVSSEAGGRILYPTLRVVAGQDFQLAADGTLRVVVPNMSGVAVRDATRAEADEFHRDLEGDRVQVLLMTPPGYGSGYKNQRILREMHSPSGLSFRSLTRQAAPVQAEAPGQGKLDGPGEFPLQEAAASYSGISHSGTSRATADAGEFQAYIDAARDAGAAVARSDAQKAAVARAVDALRADYLAQYRRLLSVLAGTYSGFVAGRSGLNSKQADKRNSAYDRAIDTFVAWQKANQDRVRQAALDARTDEEKAADRQAAEQARAEKAQREEDGDRRLMRKILSWKKGSDPVAITKTANLAGVNFGKDGYPTSIKLAPTDGVMLTDDKFDLAALFRKRGASVPESKRRVRELVDAVKAEDAEQELAEPTAAETAEPSKTPTLDAHTSLMERVREGKVTADEFKAGFAAADAGHDALLAELGTMKKDHLLKSGGYSFFMRYRNDKKGDIVAALANRVLDEYALGRSYGSSSFVMSAAGIAAHRKAQDAALRELVANTTDEDIQKHAQEVAAARAEAAGRKEAQAKTLADPQTLADFRAVMRHYIAEGDSRQEAFLRLSPEQRARYDALEAESTKDAREQAKAKLRTQVATAGQLTTGEVIETKHTQKGHDLFVVQLAERVSREDYDTLNASARRMGGSYSSYRGNGAVPGFQFRTREAAQAFGKLVAGDAADAQAVAEARRDAFADDRSQSAVERLRAMAEALQARADESLGRERKVNTERRARMASSAEAAARADKALAGTMANLAQAIEGGKTQFLDAVRQKVQVELLARELRTAKDAQIRAKYPTYAEQERYRGEPADAETVDFANFPSYTAMRSDLAALGRQMLDVEGTKKLGARLMTVADDVSEAYTDWAKQNLLQVSRFGRAGELAEFGSREEAERAIRRSGIAGKAIVLPIKRGQNRVVLAPSEAMKLGLWDGDGDKRITLTGEFGQELVEAVGRRASGTIRLPWVLEAAHDKRKRLASMGIFTGSEYRAALREFAGLQEAVAAPDKIKQMERAMVGRRADGLDFFPTSEAVVETMLDAAEISEGMAVLEPSAGMGHIADAIREKAGVEPDVVELSGERRGLLEAKGYSLVGSDFTEMTPRESAYDRIVMNPPFSKGRDIQHVMHAYELLRPGGRLVALMGEGAFFHSNKAAENFRAWLDERGATTEKLPDGAFMDPALPVNTGANARMVVIDKPAGAEQGSPADGGSEPDIARFGQRRGSSIGTPTDRAVTDMAREGRSAPDILRMVAGTSRSRFNRQVARLLLKTGAAPSVSLEQTSLGGGDGFAFLAKYSRKHEAITLTPGAQAQAEQIFLHETIHAATLRALDRKGLASLQMRRLYEHVKRQGGAAGHYGMKNVGEFVAEAFTNPEFQRALRQIDAPSGSALRSAWDGFVRILRSILSLPQDGHDALSRALEVGVAVMREDMALRERERGRQARASGDAFVLSPATRSTFEERIDVLFSGGKATTGTRVLDRSDVMGLLGHPDVPLMLNERHLLDGLTNHPEMTAAAWKKVPSWLENPAMVYSDPRDTGRLVLIAPDLLAGYPVMMVVEPKAGNPARGKDGTVPAEQLLVTVYAKTGSKLPAPGFLASSGNLLYLDTKNAPEVLQRAGVQFPGQAALQRGRQKILTDKHLNGWRKAHIGKPPGTTDFDATTNGSLPSNARSDAGGTGIVAQQGEDGQSESEEAFFGAADLARIKASAIDQITQTFTHPGKVSLWDKTVGTMRHLGERVPQFKPVFDAAQRFIDDVSMLANDAADFAPRLMPRVETLADLRKKPITAADNKAVAKPLFEGTLMWARDLDGTPVTTEALNDKYRNATAGEKAQILLRTGKIQPQMLKVWQGQPLDRFEAIIKNKFDSTILKPGVVWSAKELKTLFGLSDGQVSLYQEARAAIDRSIDMTARTDMLRLMGEEYAAMREAVLGQPTLQDAFDLVVETLQADAREKSGQADRLLQISNQVVNRFEQANELTAHGYAPLSRFGRYTVDVVDQAGERQYFGMFESQREANQMAMRMRDVFKGAAVTQGTMSQQAFQLFQGITPESLEQFGSMLGLKSDGNEAKDKAFQAYLQLAKNNHSALKRLIHRKGIDGYSGDVGRVLASFVYSNARLGSGGLNAGTMERAVEGIPKEMGELRDVAMGLRSYIQDPQEEGQAVRGMLFAQYLGGSVASAMVNMTQPFQITMPWLSQYGGMAKAGKQMARALKDMATKGHQYEPDLAKALKDAEDDGTVSPQEIHQLMAQARGTGSLRTGDGTKLGDARAAASNNWERVKVAWGQPFALAEQFNRRSTFIAAYRTAKEQGIANPAQFARAAVLETQFLYSKANKPRWARGAIGGTLFAFKTYSVSYLELMHRMWTQGGPEGKRAVGWAVAMLLLMGGAGGLPFMEDAEDLIDGAGQLMGYNLSSKQWRKQLLSEVVGKELAEFMEQGISGLPGAPIDVSGRLGMGNLIPGTGLFMQKQNRERDLLEVAGPAGDLVSRAFSGARKALGGDIGGAALEAAPTAVRNAAKGIDMATSGIYKDTKGYKVIDTTLAEAAAKFAGFQPKSVAEVQEGNSFMQRAKSFYIQTSSDIKAQWAQAVFEQDDAALQRVRDRLAAWNRDNPEQPITVKIPDIMKRVREMGKDRTQRIADTAPKALRQQMREMAREAG